MFSILNKPYPRNSDFKFRLRIVVLSGGIVSVVLFFIFSLQNNAVISSELIWNAFLFGLVTVIAASIYIATVSAFSAVNFNFLPTVIQWLWPTIIGVPLLLMWINFYKRKFTAGKKVNDLVEVKIDL
ncbi:MAG: hypothetical protein ABIT08_00225 [Bacteroidia bacterium]